MSARIPPSSLAPRPLLALLALVAISGAAPARAAVCDLSVTLSASPTNPASGQVVTWTLAFCDSTGFRADVFSSFTGISSTNWGPATATWTTCPTGGCGGDGTTSLTIDAFEVQPNSCVTFTFTVQLQQGLGGQSVCLQASNSLRSTSPPSGMFPCNKRSDDTTTPVVQDSTCVTVQSPPGPCAVDAVVTPAGVFGCAGQAESLSAASSTSTACPGGLSYQWMRNGLDIPGATGVTHDIPATEPAGGAQYRCRVWCTAEPTCLDLSNEVQVTLFESLIELVAASVACPGDPVSVTVAGGTGCTIDCGNGDPLINACTGTCTYPTPGNYTITGTGDDGQCPGVVTQLIDVVSGNVVACIETLGDVCESPVAPTLVLVGSCTPPGATHAWTTSLGTFDDPSLPFPTLSLPDVAVRTTVTLTLTVSAGTCAAPDSEQASFDLIPPPVVDAQADTLAGCVGQAVAFTGSATGAGPFAWDWDFGDGNGSTAQSPSHAYAGTGNYPVTLTVTDTSTGCTGTDGPVVIAISAPPSIAACIDPVADLCEDQLDGPTDVALSSCSQARFAHAWSSTLGTFDDPTARQPTLTLPDVAAPTTVTVTLVVTDGAGACPPTGTITETFVVNPVPRVLITAVPNVACENAPVQFVGGGTEAVGPFSVDWDFGDGNGTQDPAPIHSYAAAGAYDVTLTVTDDVTGCTATGGPYRVDIQPCTNTLCLYRADLPVRAPFDPTTLFFTPPNAQGISILGAPHICPFMTGDVDPGAILDGVDLHYYQVDNPLRVLRLTRSGNNVSFTF